MLEGKTANNIVDRYHRIVTGDQNQIELGIIPEGKIAITENGSDIDVTQYAKADVNVSGGITYPTITISASGHPKFAGSNMTFYVQYLSEDSATVKYIEYKSSDATYEDKTINCFSQSWYSSRVEGFLIVLVDAASTTSTLTVSGTNANVLKTTSYFTDRKLSADTGHNQCSYVAWFVATGNNPKINISWS